MSENKIQVWNYESSEIRTVQVNGEPWFVLSDVCKVLELSTPARVAERLEKDEVSQTHTIDRMGREQKTTIINESGLYTVILRSDKPQAKPFRKWVTSEVLPSIRKHGCYGKPMTTAEQIQILAQGNIELEHRVDKVEDKITNLEENMPLYGCEIDEIQKHVKRRGVDILGGKQSEAYRDASIRGSLYSDIYSQLKREFGCVSSYKSIKRKYIADAHEFIDCYATSQYLQEQIDCVNAQICF